VQQLLVASVQELHLYVDFKLDESYTPSKISVQAGNTYQDVKEIKVVELEEPSGWVVVPLGTPIEVPGGMQHDHSAEPCAPLHAYLLQLGVLANHQNGRDTHVRAVHVYGEIMDPLQRVLGFPLPVSTPEMCMYAQLR
jgi:anaphase-promoting complex subunit 10